MCRAVLTCSIKFILAVASIFISRSNAHFFAVPCRVSDPPQTSNLCYPAQLRSILCTPLPLLFMASHGWSNFFPSQFEERSFSVTIITPSIVLWADEVLTGLLKFPAHKLALEGVASCSLGRDLVWHSNKLSTCDFVPFPVEPV